ncbi:MAG: single-stranded DNA-binding protein [Mycoplasmataceae bacterium RV_VA103A]|nr:MAG: single-stranded DNA-binding protein [Mycoplasmataceae bacterium RV_VA103A]
MNEQINKLKTFSDSDTCQNEEKASQKTEVAKIIGTLTSRIETKQDKATGEPFYYGFFKLTDQEQEIPVIFKEKKPNIPKGSLVELTGQWAQSNGSRPSFTVTSYQIYKSANIYQKLVQIQAKTGQITKAEENKFGKYKYFTEKQAFKILKPLLAEHKLTLTFSDKEGHFTSQKTEKEWVVNYLKQAILTNSEAPFEQLTFHYWAIGSNLDPAKAKGCAETYAIKYFLTKFFLIPTTDELDPDATRDHEYANRLKNGQQETAEQIHKRHQERDQKRITDLKAKYGADWKLSSEYKLWRGNL